MAVFKFLILTTIITFLPLLPLHAREHEIRPGDTISKIARQYGVAQKALMKLNNIDKPGALHIDDVLLIPETLIGNARRKHSIKSGDTLVSISKKYKVPIGELQRLNRLGPREPLSIGRILAIPNKEGDSGPSHPAPEMAAQPQKPLEKRIRWSGGIKGLARSAYPTEKGVVHTVLPGQSIAMIARAYNVDAKRLARRNRVTKKSPLIPGREITIMGAKRPVPARTNVYRPHSVQFIRIKKTRRTKLQLINRSGTVNARSRKIISRLLGYKRVHPRLVSILQRVAERFPGHAIEIISGYRKPAKRRRGKKLSPHARGVAIDFRLQGVSNELLYEYISSFAKVGAGYYPNSIHVHLDVRNKKYLWTDVSQRGEPALYVNPGETGHWDTIADSVDDPEAPSPPDADSDANTDAEMNTDVEIDIDL